MNKEILKLELGFSEAIYLFLETGVDNLTVKFFTLSFNPFDFQSFL